MPTTPYITVDEFRTRSDIPAEFVLEVEERYPGYVAGKILAASALIDTRLAKRRKVPLTPPFPTVVQQWVIDLVSPGVWRKRGYNASDEGLQDYMKAADRAYEQLDQVANSDTGLYELPLAADEDKTALRGTGLSYSEQSPYVFLDMQREEGRAEDNFRKGTSR